MTLAHRFGATLTIALVAAGTCIMFGAFAPLAAAAGAAPTSVGGAGATAEKPQTAPYDPTVVDKTLGLVMNKIASLFAWLLGVAAITLDYVVFYTVIKMGDFVSSVQGVENIGIAWRVLRDIGNIALIFGFLASGIAIIVNSSFYGFGSKMLPMLLVAAVFINFSLFISSAIIDVGNIFATQIYTQINNGTVPTPESMKGNLFRSVSNEGISNRIMSVLGLAQIYQTGASDSSKADPSGKITGGVLNGSGPWYVGFMAILLFITAAFVFFSLAFILVARFVALIFLIIIAPLGFAGLAIPNLSGLAKQWWKHLFEQMLTAPVLLLLLYVALAVITDAKFLLRAGGWTTNATNAGSAWQGFLNTGNVANFGNFFSILVSFIIAMGLLLAVIVVAKRMSAFGASGAMKLGSKLSGFGLASAAMASAPGFMGRQTLGRASQIGARSLRNTRFARIPILGSGVVGALDKGAAASFDARPASGTAKVFGTDFNVGKQQKGGYHKTEEDATKAREKYAKELGQNSEEKKKAEAEKKELEAMTERHKEKLEEKKDEVTVARAAATAAARTHGAAPTSATEASLRRFEADLAHARAEHKTLEELQKAELKKQQDIEEKARTVAQQEFAESLESRSVPFFGGWRFRNTKAAENIRKEAKKSKTSRELTDAVREVAREERAAGGGAPTTPVTPPGGAGT